MRMIKTAKLNIVTIVLAVLMSVVVLLPLSAMAADDSSVKHETISTGTTETTSSGAEKISYTWISSKDAGDDPVKENTWYLSKDGKTPQKSDGVTCDVILESSENTEGQLEWTYTFAVANDDTDYYVYEEMTKNGELPIKSDYNSSGSDGATATPQDPGLADGSSKTYTITNSSKVGSLVVSKKVEIPEGMAMYDPNQEFLFTVTLEDVSDSDTLAAKIKGTKIFGTTQFVDGVATFALKAGDTLTIDNIPANLMYTVSEAKTDNYKTTSTGEAGIIKDGETQYAAFINTTTYEDPGRTESSFKLTKAVEDDGNLSSQVPFEFRVSFENLDPYDEIKGTITGGFNEDGSKIEGTVDEITITANEIGSAEQDVTLKQGQAIEFTGVPVDAKYQVIEKASSLTLKNGDVYTPSYTVVDAKNLKFINSASGYSEEGKELATSNETVDDGEDVTITFTNTIKRKQNLTLEKKSLNVLGFDDTGDKTDYEFFLEINGLEPDQVLEYVYYTTAEDGVIEQSYNATADSGGILEVPLHMQRNEKIIVKDIPLGSEYRVTESKNKKIPSYKITATDNTGAVIMDGDNAKIIYEDSTGRVDTKLATEAQNINANENPVVIFTNQTQLVLPITGGQGRVLLFTIAGTCIAVGVIFHVTSRRRRA